jgi:hypothetical protein
MCTEPPTCNFLKPLYFFEGYGSNILKHSLQYISTIHNMLTAAERKRNKNCQVVGCLLLFDRFWVLAVVCRLPPAVASYWLPPA